MAVVGDTFRIQEKLVSIAVILAAGVIAVVSARPYAGAWNDGSRLATVECLVDHHTLAIDRSIFVCVPQGRSPYPSGDAPSTVILQNGTADKLLIDGQFYSDKSPVPALLLAVIYQILQWCTGLRASHQPELFCCLMNLLSAGLAYVVAVWCVFRLGRPLQLPLSLRVLLAGSFALATVAVVYVRHVNSHILLLAVAAALMLALAHLAQQAHCGIVPVRSLLAVGSLAGLGYAIDLGAGPMLLACTAVLVAWRCRRFPALALFASGALPWLVLHHAVNYTVGGTLQPANAVTDYFAWEGCPFPAQKLTGSWNHPSVGKFLVYAAALLFGKYGFVGHNLPLFLALGALLARCHKRWSAEVVFAASWCGATWLVYAVTSTNYAGQCCSIRWFVPLLAPAYYGLAVFLRHHPECRGDLWILSGWGAMLMGIAWWYGPWIGHMVPGSWPLQGAALLSWAGYRLARRRPRPDSLPAVATLPPRWAKVA